MNIPLRNPYKPMLEERSGFILKGRSRYKTRNKALICEFETLDPTPRTLWVANTHLYWDPKFPDLKTLQAYTLLKQLEKIMDVPTKKFSPPLVICGDFNSMPTSGMYDLYTKRKLPCTHADIKTLDLKDLTHLLPLKSAYSGLGEPLTNITKGFSGTLDYIFFNPNKLAVRNVLSPLSAEDIDKHVGLPSVEFSSDHSALLVEVDFLK